MEKKAVWVKVISIASAHLRLPVSNHFRPFFEFIKYRENEQTEPKSRNLSLWVQEKYRSEVWLNLYLFEFFFLSLLFKRGECTETLRNRIRELEAEGKKLTMDMKVKEDQIRELELKVQVRGGTANFIALEFPRFVLSVLLQRWSLGITSQTPSHLKISTWPEEAIILSSSFKLHLI